MHVLTLSVCLSVCLCVWTCVCVCVCVHLRVCVCVCFPPPGQAGQQVVTQIIRGQAVSTAISGASPVTTVAGQRVGSAPKTPGQPITAQTPQQRVQQGQGQVKLTLAQLTQLTQVTSATP